MAWGTNEAQGGSVTATATRIPYGCAAGNCYDESADFTWDNSTKSLRLAGTTPVFDMVGGIWRFRIMESSSGSGVLQLNSSTVDRWLELVTAGTGVINFKPGGTQRLRLDTGPNATWAEGVNHVLGTATGTKWGTATGQKQAWWGSTPVVQQVLATGAGATADNIITLLQTLGLCKQS